jgi:hypothetical protein
MLAVIVIVAPALALALRRRLRDGDVAAIASALLAAPAREWLEAMQAEYAAIDGRRERRRFARGCVTRRRGLRVRVAR